MPSFAPKSHWSIVFFCFTASCAHSHRTFPQSRTKNSLSLSFCFFLNLQIMYFISSWVHWSVVVQEMCLLHWSWQRRWHKIVYIILFFLMYLGSIVLPLFLYSINNFCYLYFCWIVYIEVNHIYLSFGKKIWSFISWVFFPILCPTYSPFMSDIFIICFIFILCLICFSFLTC